MTLAEEKDVINSQKSSHLYTDEEFWDTNRRKDATEVSYNKKKQ